MAVLGRAASPGGTVGTQTADPSPGLPDSGETALLVSSQLMLQVLVWDHVGTLGTKEPWGGNKAPNSCSCSGGAQV